MPTDPTARTLQLLSLLHARAQWPAEELAERLGTSTRTLRRDAHRLRTLGYTVQSRPGPGSGYRLVPGVTIPPLLFTADEIAVIASGLRVVHARRGDAAAAQALGKLAQVLPPTLRRRAAATDLALEVLEILGDIDGPDAADIGVVADAVADQGRLRFTYTDHRARASLRIVEPYRHVLRGVRWYLVAYDIEREDWRTFRFDRITNLERMPGAFQHHEPPHSSIQRWFDTDFGRRL